MEELKPCPFCGGIEFFVTTGTEDREGFPVNITCDQCGCNGPSAYIENKDDLDDIYIIAKRTQWNDRHITQQSLSGSADGSPKSPIDRDPEGYFKDIKG